MRKEIKIKSFSMFIKDKLTDEDKDGVLDEPIHFKGLRLEDKDGVLDEPIHFKNRKDKKKLHEAETKSKTSHGSTSDWLSTNDNKHLSKEHDHHEISEKLHKGQKLDDHHVDAIKKYTKDSQRLNKGLIKSQGKIENPKHKKHADSLDDAIKKNSLRHKLVVHSGVSFDPRKKVGTNGILKSHAYISTTHSKEIAHEFAKPSFSKKTGVETKHIIRLNLKKGDPAMHVEHHSSTSGEHETIIKRGSRLKLHKTATHVDTWGGITHVHHMSMS
jgi:hypothetical protein